MHHVVSSSEIIDTTEYTESTTDRARRPGPGLVRYGLPCANCRVYYEADLAACPICRCRDRVSPIAELFRPTSIL
jgi:hypothetical protein